MAVTIWNWVAKRLKRRRAPRTMEAAALRAAELGRRGQFLEAAHLYAAMLRTGPRDPEIQVACAEMLEQGGDLKNALSHYREALRRAPGHAPAAAALRELEGRAGSHGPLQAPDRAVLDIDHLVPELAPGTVDPPAAPSRDHIHLARLGAYERSHRGMFPTLRGIVAIRGFCITSEIVREVEVRLDGRLVCTAPLRSYPVGDQPGAGPERKHVFNLWLDLSEEEPGGYDLEVRLVGSGARTLTRRDRIVIAPPLREEDYPDSDALLSLQRDGDGPIDREIDARPSVVRPAARSFFDPPPANILLIRADQLGDFVCSVPAILRIRDAFKGARLTALVQKNNEALCRSLGVFDTVLTFDFRYDDAERRRVLPMAAQATLAAELRSFHFDLAVDLSDNDESRPLLVLAGARQTYGFRPTAFPWMSASLEAYIPDPVNGLERIAYSQKKLAFAEWLAALARPAMPVIRREDLDPAALARFGVSPGRYVLIHTGARLAFSRWPHFDDLARRLLGETDLAVVILTDDEREAATFRERIPASGRVTVLAGPLAFDEFDLLISSAAAFVGNDSGPKHLAALRGVPVVSLHLARLNWTQWAQAEQGLVISRKVPCAGCAIHDHPEECGRDFTCLTSIKPEEVAGAVRRCLAPGAAQAI